MTEQEKKIQESLQRLMIEFGARMPTEVIIEGLEGDSVVVSYLDDDATRMQTRVLYEKLAKHLEADGVTRTQARKDAPTRPQISVQYSVLATEASRDAFRAANSVLRACLERKNEDGYDWYDEVASGVRLLGLGLVTALAPPLPAQGGFLVQFGLFPETETKPDTNTVGVMVQVAAVDATEEAAIALLQQALSDLPYPPHVTP